MQPALANIEEGDDKARAWARAGLLSPEQLAQLLMMTDDQRLRTRSALSQLSQLADTDRALFDRAVAAMFAQDLAAGTKTVAGAAPVEVHGGDETRPSDTEADVEVAEIVVLCVDVSSSMRTPFEVDNDPRTRDRTRLEGVKQMFYGFRDQTTTFTEDSPVAPSTAKEVRRPRRRRRHKLGLLSYDHRITIHTEPTTNFDVFEEVIDDMETSGSTAIYEAIQVACDMLKRASALHPKADLRVVCLSDGQNNRFEVTAEDALRSLQEVGGVCDCLIVGDNADDALLRLVAATDGESFSISGLADAFECLESEAVISLSARRSGAPRPARKAREVKSLSSVKKAVPRRGAMMVATPASPSDKDTAKVWETGEVFLASCSKEGRRAGKQARLHKDIQGLQKLSTPSAEESFAKLFVGTASDGAVAQLKLLLVMQRLPFRGHAVEIHLTPSPTYPFAAPRLRIATPVYHYAVSTSGGVCLDILRDAWSPAVSLEKVVSELMSLLEDPQKDDPTASHSVRSWLSEQLRVDPEAYFAEAATHTARHCRALPASTPVAGISEEQWRQLLL